MSFFDNVVLILTILGSLTLFLYGMKLMSESLQKIGGNSLRGIFSLMASTRTRAVASGLVVTAVIQSSTTVTVMLVSFTNAGFFTLSQALGLMMGANIGTTITAWLVSYFGFNFDLSVILLPILGLTLPLLFFPSASKRSIGEFLVGFAILFLGLQFLKNSLPDISGNTRLLGMIAGISDYGIGSALLFALAGIVITVIVRASSATIALTMVMCHNGWISYDDAAAMVLGENIGTTLTANIAAIVANRSAKRLALGHTLFNVFGSTWVLVFFSFFVGLSADAARAITGYSPLQNIDAVPIGISVFHTGFNIINTLLLAGFIPLFKKLLEAIIPLKTNEKKSFSLKYINAGYLSLNEMSLLQAREEIYNFGKHVAYMYSLIPEYLIEKREKKFQKLRKQIYKCEEQADEMEAEIRHYLTRTAEQDLSESGSRRISSMLKIIDDIESIADQCMQMERTINRKNIENAWFTQEMRDDINNLFILLKEAIDNMNLNLSQDYRPGILAKASETELKINELRDRLLHENSLRVESGESSYQKASFFTSLVSQCEKMGDHIINVNQAIASNAR
ncbi:MAG: Na/Pi cotransporter family protein [Bacteroidales bacterium]|nr:Na/Pi cotransporter family protein [Bacteroidales bacterium]